MGHKCHTRKLSFHLWCYHGNQASLSLCFSKRSTTLHALLVIMNWKVRAPKDTVIIVWWQYFYSYNKNRTTIIMMKLPITSCPSLWPLNHPNSVCGGMFKLNTKFDVDSLFYSLSHFECDSHTVHMLTQWHLPPPLSSAVKSSLFTHEHSSPLSLAANLHWCNANCSRYTNNGWTFSGQTSYLIFQEYFL